MDFLKSLFGQTGGKRSRRSMKKSKRGGAACESGEACAAAFGADSSLAQGETFAKMTAPYHGGKRRRSTRARRNYRGGAADLSQAFEAIPAEIHQRAGTAVLDDAIAELSQFTPTAAPQTGGSLRNRRRSRRHRGGAADLGEAFQAPPADIAEKAGTSVLDTAMAQLSKFIPNHNGGSRRTRRSRRGGALGSAPIDAPAMLLRPEDYQAAFLNPQWEQENLVNPNFHGPATVYTPPTATTGGKRKATRKGRKATRKGRKGSRKGRKGSRKATKKCPRGKVYRKTYNRKGRRIFGKCVRK
jgi:hypothetical protein